MKLLSGALLLLAAEQAYAHANLVQFPNQDSAAQILIPGSIVFLILGLLMMTWGLLSELRTLRRPEARSE